MNIKKSHYIYKIMIAIILINLSIFTGLYVYLRLHIEDEKIDSRIININISFIHAYMTCIFGIIHILTTSCLEIQNNQFTNYILGISSSYFIYDLIWSYILNETIYILHHVLALLPILYSMYFNIYGSLVCSFLLIGEFTNPIMQFLELNNYFNLTSGLWLSKLEYNNIIMYCFLRFLVAPYYLLYISQYIECKAIIYISGFSLFILMVGSYQWVQDKYKIMPDWEEYMYYG